MTPLHKAARAHAEAGIPVFPCHVESKKPATPRGFKDATTDLDQIDRWWGAQDYNIGLEPEAAGWAVIDLDVKSDGPANWEKLVNGTTEQSTYTVTTPSGGKHLYFAGRVPASAGKLGPGIDTRGRGSYVLVPPSVIAESRYTVSDDRDPSPLPAWVIPTLGSQDIAPAVAPEGVEFDGADTLEWAVKVIEETAAKATPDIGTGLNERTVKLACKLGDGPLPGLAVSQEEAVELILNHWSDADRIEDAVRNAYKSRLNGLGCGEFGTPERKYGSPETLTAGLPAPSVPNVGELPLFRSWPSIKDAYFEPPQWVWKDRLLAYEPNLYTGDAGVGKTTLAENIAVSVVAGIPLLGAATRRMHVALLVAEDHYGPVRDNLKALAQTLGITDQLDNIHTLSVKSDRVPGGHILARIDDSGFVQDTPFMRERVAPFLMEFDSEVLFVIDPLAEFVAFNNLSDQSCRALATNWLAGVCAMSGGRVTTLVNDHPSKASMASGAHYAGSVQLKAAFSLVATLIGKDWQGSGENKQRKLSFEVKKGRYAAEDSVEFYRNSTSAAFTLASVPMLDPRVVALRVYQHIAARCNAGLVTGLTNHADYGPALIGADLELNEEQVKLAGNYCRAQGWLVHVPRTGGKSPGGWRLGEVTPLLPTPEEY